MQDIKIYKKVECVYSVNSTSKGDLAPKDKNYKKEKIRAMEQNPEMFCDLGGLWKMLDCNVDEDQQEDILNDDGNYFKSI